MLCLRKPGATGNFLCLLCVRDTGLPEKGPVLLALHVVGAATRGEAACACLKESDTDATWRGPVARRADVALSAAVEDEGLRIAADAIDAMTESGAAAARLLSAAAGSSSCQDRRERKQCRAGGWKKETMGRASVIAALQLTDPESSLACLCCYTRPLAEVLQGGTAP